MSDNSIHEIDLNSTKILDEDTLVVNEDYDEL